MKYYVAKGWVVLDPLRWVTRGEWVVKMDECGC